LFLLSSQLTLSSPNKVTDEKGNEGTWTMVYDEAFEVRINGQVFFSFFKYKPKAGTALSSEEVADYISICTETLVRPRLCSVSLFLSDLPSLPLFVMCV
jgi:hypothetical protein